MGLGRDVRGEPLIDANDAIHAAAVALIAADNGASGLNGGVTSNAFVRQVYEYGDSLGVSGKDRPYIETHIQTADRSPNPKGASGAAGTAEFFDAVLTFLIHCDRDENAGLAVARRVEARLRTVFQNVSLTALVDADDATRTWSFGPAARTHCPASFVMGDKIVRRSPSYRIGVTKGLS